MRLALYLLDVGDGGMVLDGHQHQDEPLDELYASRGGHAHVQENAEQDGLRHQVEDVSQQHRQAHHHRHKEGAQSLLWRGKDV